MSDFPGTALPAHTLITNFDRMYGTWPLIFNESSTPVWPSANRAIFSPVWVPQATIVTQIAWRVGGASSGNVDAGIYDEHGVKILSTGSTACASTNTTQLVDVTDTLLAAGAYYLAMAVDNTTARFMRSNLNTLYLKMLGVMSQDSAFPLPATAAMTASVDSYVPWITCTTRVPVL
jgi:hypothetical protein